MEQEIVDLAGPPLPDGVLELLTLADGTFYWSHSHFAWYVRIWRGEKYAEMFLSGDTVDDWRIALGSMLDQLLLAESQSDI